MIATAPSTLPDDRRAVLDEPAPAEKSPRDKWALAATWVMVLAIIAAFGWHLAWLGIDLRNGFWEFSGPIHFQGDLSNAFEKGDAVLRAAEKLAPAEPRPGDATVAMPHPMLLDGPMDWQSVLARYRRLKPVYGQIFRAWEQTYDHLEQESPDGNFDLDYPPMRLLVMTIWVWHIEAGYPTLRAWPASPALMADPHAGRQFRADEELAWPLLKLNTFCEGVAALAMFFLVWVWVAREGKGLHGRTWQERWGDPLLLVPVIVLGIAMLIRPLLSWHQTTQADPIGPIDARIASPGFWIFLILRFLSVVCLARFLPRPFRAPVCGMVAATLLWINPALLLDGHAWPQWDVWMLPIFLIAALLASLDWWLLAGLVLGVGMMFKGQLIFVIPMMALWPLFAGWPGRWMRIMAGLGVGAGVVVWPWVIRNATAEHFVISVVVAAGIVCVASIWREAFLFHAKKGIDAIRHRIISRGRPHPSPLPEGEGAGERERRVQPYLWVALGAGMITAAALVAWAWPGSFGLLRFCTVILLLGILVLPWVLPRRLIAAWLVFVLAAGIWLSAFGLDGDFSWWDVGFMYGAQKHQVMQLGGNGLSNVSSILHERYGWNLHDPVTTIHVPFCAAPVALDLQQTLGWIFAITLVLCAVGLAIHSRRNDPRVLVALTAPWVLFPTILTQMAARYTILPAAISGALVGVSVGMSLWQLVLTLVACCMLGGQMLEQQPDFSPVAFSITQPTHPDLGWMMILIAAVFLYAAVKPGKNPRRAELE